MTTSATWRTKIGTPLFVAITTSRMSSSFSTSITPDRSTRDGSSGSMPPPSRPMARTLWLCEPSVRTSPPTLAFERLIASSTCSSVTLYCRSRRESIRTWYCLTSPP